eukprot:TRINITY_DN6035_c1_g1_i2.p1 TRINITY_DN6035_c1_g1~~TRINITY_DN6035_c1_g1_i2.p1  ORF type:complete len:2061 (+),score=631.62 TRINITY_DN6035_c1_g1_i2:89-6184(+)
MPGRRRSTHRGATFFPFLPGPPHPPSDPQPPGAGRGKRRRSSASAARADGRRGSGSGAVSPVDGDEPAGAQHWAKLRQQQIARENLAFLHKQTGDRLQVWSYEVLQAKVRKSDHPRILLASSSQLALSVNAVILRKIGMTVETTTSGRTAFQAWRDRPTYYNLLILECDLKDFDGLELIRMIRSQEQAHRGDSEGSHTPAVALTQLGDNIQECLSAGFDHFLRKPLSLHLKALRFLLLPYARARGGAVAAAQSNFERLQQMLSGIAGPELTSPRTGAAAAAGAPGTSALGDDSELEDGEAGPSGGVSVARHLLSAARQARKDEAHKTEVGELAAQLISAQQELDGLHRLVKIKDQKHSQMMKSIAHDRIRNFGKQVEHSELRIEHEKNLLELDALRRENKMLQDDLTFAAENPAGQQGGALAGKLQKIINDSSVGRMQTRFEERIKHFRKQLDQRKAELVQEQMARKLAQKRERRLKQRRLRLRATLALLEGQLMGTLDVNAAPGQGPGGGAQAESRSPDARSSTAEQKAEEACASLGDLCRDPELPAVMSWLEPLPGALLHMLGSGRRMMQKIERRSVEALEAVGDAVPPSVRGVIDRALKDSFKEYCGTYAKHLQRIATQVREGIDAVRAKQEELLAAANRAARPPSPAESASRCGTPVPSTREPSEQSQGSSAGAGLRSISCLTEHSGTRVAVLSVLDKLRTPFDSAGPELIPADGLRAQGPGGVPCRIYLEADAMLLRKRGTTPLNPPLAPFGSPASKTKAVVNAINVLRRKRKDTEKQLSIFTPRGTHRKDGAAAAGLPTDRQSLLHQIEDALQELEGAVGRRRRVASKAKHMLGKVNKKIAKTERKIAQEIEPAEAGAESPEAAWLRKMLKRLKVKEVAVKRHKDAAERDISRLIQRKTELQEHRGKAESGADVGEVVKFLKSRLATIDEDISYETKRAGNVKWQRKSLASSRGTGGRELCTPTREGPGAGFSDITDTELGDPDDDLGGISDVSSESSSSAHTECGQPGLTPIPVQPASPLSPFASGLGGSSPTAEHAVALSQSLGSAGAGPSASQRGKATRAARSPGPRSPRSPPGAAEEKRVALLSAQLAAARDGEEASAQLTGEVAAAYAKLHTDLLQLLRLLARRIGRPPSIVGDSFDGLVGRSGDGSSLRQELPGVIQVDRGYLAQFAEFLTTEDAIRALKAKAKARQVARTVSAVRLKQRFEALTGAGNMQERAALMQMINAEERAHADSVGQEAAASAQLSELHGSFRVYDPVLASTSPRDSPQLLPGRGRPTQLQRSLVDLELMGQTVTPSPRRVRGREREDPAPERASESGHSTPEPQLLPPMPAVQFTDRQSGERVTVTATVQEALQFLVGQQYRSAHQLDWKDAQCAVDIGDGSPPVWLPRDGVTQELLRVLAARVGVPCSIAPPQEQWRMPARFQLDVAPMAAVRIAEAQPALRHRYPGVMVKVPSAAEMDGVTSPVVHLQGDAGECAAAARDLSELAASIDIAAPSALATGAHSPRKAVSQLGLPSDELPQLPGSAPPDDIDRRLRLELLRVAGAERRVARARGALRDLNDALDCACFVEDQQQLAARRAELLLAEAAAVADADAAHAAVEDLRQQAAGGPPPQGSAPRSPPSRAASRGSRAARGTSAVSLSPRRPGRRPPPPSVSQGSRRGPAASSESAPPRQGLPSPVRGGGKGSASARGPSRGASRGGSGRETDRVGGWTWRDALEPQGNSGGTPTSSDPKLRALITVLWQRCSEAIKDELARERAVGTAAGAAADTAPPGSAQAARNAPGSARGGVRRPQSVPRLSGLPVAVALRREEQMRKECQGVVREAERKWRQRYQQLLERCRQAEGQAAATQQGIAVPQPQPAGEARAPRWGQRPVGLPSASPSALTRERALQGALLPLIASGEVASMRCKPRRSPRQQQQQQAAPPLTPTRSRSRPRPLRGVPWVSSTDLAASSVFTPGVLPPAPSAAAVEQAAAAELELPPPGLPLPPAADRTADDTPAGCGAGQLPSLPAAPLTAAGAGA